MTWSLPGPILKCEEDKNKIMGLEELWGLSLTDDYTIAERQLIMEWSRKAKENSKEAEESRYV